MRCPKCNAKTRVDHTRSYTALVVRTRVCGSCKSKFDTYEEPAKK